MSSQLQTLYNSNCETSKDSTTAVDRGPSTVETDEYSDSTPVPGDSTPVAAAAAWSANSTTAVDGGPSKVETDEDSDFVAVHGDSAPVAATTAWSVNSTTAVDGGPSTVETGEYSDSTPVPGDSTPLSFDDSVTDEDYDPGDMESSDSQNCCGSDNGTVVPDSCEG